VGLVPVISDEQTAAVPQKPAAEKSEHCRLVTATDGEWRTLWRAEGENWPQVLQAFQRGELPCKLLACNLREPRTAWLTILPNGRRLVIKHDDNPQPHWEKRLYELWGGSFYTRLLRLTAEARKKGCRAVQDIYLASERRGALFAREAWLIAENVEGTTLCELGLTDYSGYREDLLALLNLVHGYGLASNDFHASNIVLRPNGSLCLIDLELNFFLLACQARDVVQFKKNFALAVADWELPFPTFFHKLYYGFLSRRDALRDKIKRLRGKAL
jgi:heptose II phosphotransferase